MRRLGRKNRNKRDVGKVVTGILIGSVVGATVGLLMAPVSGPEIRRRIAGEVKGVREKAGTAVGNVESKARELAQQVTGQVDDVKGSIARRRKVASAES